MSAGWRETGLWRDVEELPASLAATLDGAEGFDDVARVLGGARRVVATGNGASSYAAHALWLAALGRPAPVELVAVPAGLLFTGSFALQKGDVVLAFSSSGELRDLVELLDGRLTAPLAVVTARAESTLGRAALARALVRVVGERAVTHTQGFCGAVAAALAIWARVCSDAGLAGELAELPGTVTAALLQPTPELPNRIPAASIAFGTGPAWAAALETALLLKEVARIPAEGVETREAATTAMTGLAPGHLAVSHPSRGDGPPLRESEAVCRKLGAAVVRLRGGEVSDPRLSPITTFPAATALSIELALRGGLDPDRPGWTEAYYGTARSAT